MKHLGQALVGIVAWLCMTLLVLLFCGWFDDVVRVFK